MILATALLVLFASETSPGPMAQAPIPGAVERPEALDKRLEELKKSKNWSAIADAIEAMPPQARTDRMYVLLEALVRCARWNRVLEVCEEPSLKGKGGPNPGTLLPRGRALVALGRHAEAMEWYREGGRRGNPMGYMEGCSEAEALGDWKAMEECADALVDRYPTNGVYLGWKGEALARGGKFAQAEPLLNEAVHLVPTLAMAWADLACCFNERQVYQEGYDAASRALSVDPRLMEGFCNRGRACMGLKRYREGRNDYASALALAPKDPALVRNLKMNIAEADRYLAYQASMKAKRPGQK